MAEEPQLPPSASRPVCAGNGGHEQCIRLIFYVNLRPKARGKFGKETRALCMDNLYILITKLTYLPNASAA